MHVEDLTWALKVSVMAKFWSNYGQDIWLRFGHWSNGQDVKLKFGRDFDADFWSGSQNVLRCNKRSWHQISTNFKLLEENFSNPI